MGIPIEDTVAVLSVDIAIADELFFAVFASQVILHLVFVAVPISHPALVVAIALHLATGCLRNRLATVLADHSFKIGCMTLQVGFDGVSRNSVKLLLTKREKSDNMQLKKELTFEERQVLS